MAHMLQRLQAEAAAARGEKNGSNQRDVSDDRETESSESGSDDRDADSETDGADVDSRKPTSAGSASDSRAEEAEESNGEEAERSAETKSRRQRTKLRWPAKAAASGLPLLPSNVENLSSKDLQSLMRAVKSAISVAQKKLAKEELAVA